MTWVIIRDAAIVYRGAYSQCLDVAETYQLAAQAFHPDGTELPPRFAPGVHLLPEEMLPVRFRRRAA
ncbi:hypothetical protein MKK84_32925 [Methylobacterium sp. E-065]|uniref:hypothetical protein n=1 Tax=Methylobacterium sp. E-065 TaxID=2836583 RepID=UPI001FB97BEE|nr:hypothetical protein [Methylobacterium sp. E-065]MCJ2022153.1 hypothetical protein [Methylobacterium sp. E-065]